MTVTTKLLLIDLDGTIRNPINGSSGSKFINKPDDQQIIEESAQVIKNWFKESSNANAKIVGISNQGGVAAGHKTLQNCILEQQVTIRLLQELGIVLESIYICTDFGGYECFNIFQNSFEMIADGEGLLKLKTQLKHSALIQGKFRKPNSAMLDVARLTHDYHTAECLYIGNGSEDEQAALNAKIPFLWVSEFIKKYKD